MDRADRGRLSSEETVLGSLLLALVQSHRQNSQGGEDKARHEKCGVVMGRLLNKRSGGSEIEHGFLLGRFINVSKVDNFLQVCLGNGVCKAQVVVGHVPVACSVVPSDDLSVAGVIGVGISVGVIVRGVTVSIGMESGAVPRGKAWVVAVSVGG